MPFPLVGLPLVGVHQVRLETELLPTVDLMDASAGEAGQPWLARLLKPRIVVETALGPLDYYPAGAPTPGRLWPFTMLLLGAVAALALYGLSKLLR